MRPATSVLAFGLSLALAAGGCTTTVAGPAKTRPSSTTATTSPTAAAGSAGGAAGGAAPPVPLMTPVDRLRCSTTTVRGSGSGPLRVEGRWRPDPGALPDETVTVTRGPDADSCPGELPPEPDCAQAIPWTGLSVDALVHASGVQRWVSSSVPGPDAPRPSAPDQGGLARTLTYTVMTPPPGSRLAIGPALLAGAAACANTTVRTEAGVTVLRGTVVDRWAPATGGAPRAAGFIAVISPGGVGWALLGGPAWPGHDVDSASAALQAAIVRSASTPGA